MTMDAQAIMEDEKQKLMKTDTRYKKTIGIHHLAKVYKKGDKVMMFIRKE